MEEVRASVEADGSGVADPDTHLSPPNHKTTAPILNP